MNNKIFLLLVLLVSLALLITPVFAIDRNNDSNSNDDEFDSNEDILVGGDRDSHGCIPSAGYSWCEEKQKCLRVWEEDCDTNTVSPNECVCTFQYDPVCGENGITYGNKCAANCEKIDIDYAGECRTDTNNVESESCICTREYMPVCGSVKDPNCVCPKDAMCKCGAVEKTFSNKCGAKCEGAIILREGTCEDFSNETNFCGGIAGVQCKEGYECELDGIYPDAGGKCVYDCPEYMPPLRCEDGNKIIVKVDDHGCKKPVCLSVTSTTSVNQSDFYLGANWVCSNGKEYKEKSEKCMPASYWKETARKTCAQFSKCDSNVIQRPIPPATGNFILDLVARAIETSTTSNPTSTNSTSNSDSNREITTTSSTLPPCIGKNVFVNSFEFSEECKVNCDVVIDSEGCKNISCLNGEDKETKRYCNDECDKQSSEEISRLKEKCYAASGQLIIKTNEQGCTKYFCDRSTGDSYDSNRDEIYANLNCTLLSELPKEKYANCESNGGKLLVKTNLDNCITVLECVSIENEEIDSNKLNKEIIKDSTQLLALALKLEDLKIELNKTTLKVQAISDYYGEVGDTNSELKFQNAVDLLKIASSEVDALKKMIKERAGSFTETDALEVKRAVKSIKNELLNKVLMILLD